MTSVLLVYPFFRGSRDRSRFRFPPLGPAYVAAALREAGHAVELLDCTFRGRDEALERALAAKAEVVGIYAMATLTRDCLWLARRLRGHCGLLVAGGPAPTCDPAAFLGDFDVVVRGEGEQSMCEVVAAYQAGSDVVALPAPRPLATDLDAIAFPARELLPNERYIAYGAKKYGYAITTVMSTRGCPFDCEFCSNVLFGGSYRERSPGNVVDEIEEALALGYDRISFADDVFTLNRRRVVALCDEIARRGLRFAWECLGRVDSLDFATARLMKDAGCFRIFFGIESGNDEILRLMNKQVTTRQAGEAVRAAHAAGLEVGAFFILYYPGETDDTVLDTLRFAGSLPLDYLGLTMPYPLPGTALAERLGERRAREWRQEGGLLLNQTLTFEAGVSATKMRFAIVKGHVQFEMKRRLGRLAPVALKAFEGPTDRLLRRLR